MAIPITAQRAPRASRPGFDVVGAAVEGSIAGDERTWIDLDEIVELEISGVDEKDLTHLSFVGSNSVEEMLNLGRIVLSILRDGEHA